MKRLKAGLVSALAAAILLASAPASAGLISGRVYQPVSLADTEVEWSGEAPAALSVTTEDGLTLEGAHFPRKGEDAPVMLVFHGNSYNHLVMARRVEPLAAQGAGVIAASYRGYGDNPGTPSEAGLYRDAESWVAKTRELYPDARIFVFGFSLGGAVAIEMATRHDFDGVVTLGAFTRLKDAVPWIARPFVKEKYDNLAKVALINEPLFLLHGSADETIDAESAEKLEQAGGANVTRINIVGGDHWVPLDDLAQRLWQTIDPQQDRRE
ncbi:alpha/beta hydrolase [Erythrobacter sp. GH1-10]|uniref:alpha/beta hydrolase n=1 Tax=Erythrobacter sp. GH1-10 TaxID=3349334 RepID=UPI003878043F